MNIILMGPQGSGKGTQAKLISERYGIPAISTGDLNRAEMKKNSKLGKIIADCVNKGQLVPLEIMINLLKDRLSKDDCKFGYILDGFPRSKEQAEILKEIARIDAVIILDIPSDSIIKRLSTRRICSSCGEIYNTSSYSATTCKSCNSPLLQRDDDKSEDAIRNRLEVYEKQTAPLIDFYGDKVQIIDGSGSPEEVFEQIKTFLNNLEE